MTASDPRLPNWASDFITRLQPHRNDPTRQHRFQNVVWQTSTMEALMAGILTSDVTVRQVLQHGDFGVGTFEQLDGEMVLLDGRCFQVRSDGTASAADDSATSPFAVVTRFASNVGFDVTTPTSLPALREDIDAAAPARNLVTAVRIDGTFEHVTTRTVARQTEPHASLADAAATAPTSTMTDVVGTVVGFRTPDFEEGVSVPGYHLHFIDKARTRGGHVFDLRIQRGEVALSIASEVHLSLPTAGAFLSAELVQEGEAQRIHDAES
jgi:acetolactate decarboxylase